MTLRRPFNGISKLRHFLQVLAFTLVTAFLSISNEPFDGSPRVAPALPGLVAHAPLG